MNLIQQICAVVGMNIRNLPQRFASSLVVIVGSAGVVAVLVAVLAMAAGMSNTLQGTGRADRAIVLRSGSPPPNRAAPWHVVRRELSSTPRESSAVLRGCHWHPLSRSVCSNCSGAMMLLKSRPYSVASVHRRSSSAQN